MKIRNSFTLFIIKRINYIIGPWVKWARLGPSNEYRSKYIADPMTLGLYKDSNPRRIGFILLYFIRLMLYFICKFI